MNAAAQAIPQWDLLCGVAAAVCSIAWVKIFDRLKRAGVLEQKLSRKLVHITTGPIFVLTWLFFSDAPYARFIAAAVPCLNGIRLLAVGSGLISNPGLVNSMSRSGDKAELLRGPLYYIAVLAAVTVLFWRDNPAGAITVSMMCGGDGLADIVGRRFGTGKLPWNSNKSWAGSAAMFFAGMAMACGYFWLFCSLGYFECFPLQLVLPYLAVVCGACTLVESLPVNSWFDDNLSVPLVAAGVSMLVLPLAAAAAHGCSLPQQQHVLQMLHTG